MLHMFLQRLKYYVDWSPFLHRRERFIAMGLELELNLFKFIKMCEI